MTDEVDEMSAGSRGSQRIAAGGSGRTCSSEQQRADDDAKACACRPAASVPMLTAEQLTAIDWAATMAAQHSQVMIHKILRAMVRNGS